MEMCPLRSTSPEVQPRSPIASRALRHAGSIRQMVVYRRCADEVRAILVGIPTTRAGVREVLIGRGGSALRGRMSVYRSDTLPQNAVHAAFQDSRSYLWFGTQEGVVRFDGGEWKPYRMSDGLVYNFVQAIAEDRRGRLWFGTRLGLSWFDPVRLRSGGWR